MTASDFVPALHTLRDTTPVWSAATQSDQVAALDAGDHSQLAESKAVTTSDSVSALHTLREPAPVWTAATQSDQVAALDAGDHSQLAESRAVTASDFVPALHTLLESPPGFPERPFLNRVPLAQRLIALA